MKNGKLLSQKAHFAVPCLFILVLATIGCLTTYAVTGDARCLVVKCVIVK